MKNENAFITFDIQCISITRSSCEGSALCILSSYCFWWPDLQTCELAPGVGLLKLIEHVEQGEATSVSAISIRVSPRPRDTLPSSRDTLARDTSLHDTLPHATPIRDTSIQDTASGFTWGIKRTENHNNQTVSPCFQPRSFLAALPRHDLCLVLRLCLRSAMPTWT